MEHPMIKELVCRARDSVEYIGEQVSKGMDEIKEDIKTELYVTDWLTKLTSDVSCILHRFAVLEESVVELVRMDRNTESVELETPNDVKEEIERLVTGAEIKEKQYQGNNEAATTENLKTISDKICRNPISKFSGVLNEKQNRVPILPEVRLLDGSSEVQTCSKIKRREQNRK